MKPEVFGKENKTIRTFNASMQTLWYRRINSSWINRKISMFIYDLNISLTNHSREHWTKTERDEHQGSDPPSIGFTGNIGYLVPRFIILKIFIVNFVYNQLKSIIFLITCTDLPLCSQPVVQNIWNTTSNRTKLTSFQMLLQT